MNHWAEGTTVNLQAELPSIKAECRAERAQNEFKDDEDDEELVMDQVLPRKAK